MFDEAVKAGGIAVVTGAASGVGLVAAHRFVAAGLGVVLADRAGPQLDDAVAEVRAGAAAGVHVVGKPTDVTNDEDVEALAGFAFDTSPVAVVMNNAGIGGLKTKPWSERDHWNQFSR